MDNKIEIADSRDILIYAFRYALGRMSYSVSTVRDEIVRNWRNLSEADRKLYQREIQEAIDHGAAGMECDARTWNMILSLPVNNKCDPKKEK